MFHGYPQALRSRELCPAVIADELKDENRALAKREAQLEQLKREMASAYTWRFLAWEAIKSGCDPVYVALRYGFPVEVMKRAKEVHERREKEKQERINRGNEPRDLGDREVLRETRSAEGSASGVSTSEGGGD